MGKNNARVIIICILFVVLLFHACRDSDETRRVVRFGSSAGENGILMGIPGVAQEMGFIKEELEKAGYSVVFIGFLNGVSVNEAFVARELEVSTLGDVPTAIGFSNNIGTVWFALGLSSYNNELIARNNTGINSIYDLYDKRVAYAIGTTTEYFWQSLVKEYNIDETKIRKINIGGINLINAFETGDVDVIIHNENWIRRLEVQEKGKVILSTRNFPDWKPQDMIVGRIKYLDLHPQVGVAICRALIRAREAVKMNPQPYYVAISGRQLELFPELAQAIYGDDDNEFPNLDSAIHNTNIERQQRLADFLEQTDRIATHTIIENYIDNSYWKRAAMELK